jgi:hypothetical protein
MIEKHRDFYMEKLLGNLDILLKRKPCYDHPVYRNRCLGRVLHWKWAVEYAKKMSGEK